MDYLGESGIGNSTEIAPQENVHQFMDWPWFNGWCGDLDILGVKKPQSYYRDVIWGNRKISMAVEKPVADKTGLMPSHHSVIDGNSALTNARHPGY